MTAFSPMGKVSFNYFKKLKNSGKNCNWMRLESINRLWIVAVSAPYYLDLR